jgi:hypothetical protein
LRGREGYRRKSKVAINDCSIFFTQVRLSPTTYLVNAVDAPSVGADGTRRLVRQQKEEEEEDKEAAAAEETQQS